MERPVRTRELVLGIDVGSSTTSAGVLIGDRIELVADQGDAVIPSLLYVPDRGPIEVGRRAMQRLMTEPNKVVRSIKRLLGVRPDNELARRFMASVPYRLERAGEALTIRLGGAVYAPEQLVGLLLTRVRELAEVRFGAKVGRAVITLAVDAPPGYREAMRRAARIAHLDVLEMIAEPIAGALALDLHTAPADRNIVVCDFGGGTLDVSAVQQRSMAFTPIAIAGDMYLGGDDLDLALAEGIASTVVRHAGYDIHKDIVRWNELVMRCELAKKQLTTAADAGLHMRDAYLDQGKRKDLNLLLDRPWADSQWRPLTLRVRQAIVELLLKARWRPEQVDVVGLVGGSSQVPAFRALVTEMFGDGKLLTTPSPELAVARGATLLTARHRVASSRSIPVLANFPG